MLTNSVRYSYLVTGSTEQQRGDDLVSQQAGFSLHAGIACKSHQRKKLERLCRYIIRAALGRAAFGRAMKSPLFVLVKAKDSKANTLAT